MALIDDFKTRFPEFSTTDVDTYVPILQDVYLSYYNVAYSVASKEAVLNLVAHLLVGEISTSQAQSQIVASKSVGSVSTSYANQQNVSQGFSFYNTTKYGQRFWRITSSRYGGVGV